MLELQADGVSDLAALKLTGGDFAAEVALSAGVSDVVRSLVLNNTTFGPGVYGSTASGAANNSQITAAGLNPDKFFSGTGVIVVAVPEPSAACVLGTIGFAAAVRRRRPAA
jgi:hypothetical protein